MTGHHGHVGAPVFEADEYAHADFVYTGGAHAVETVDTPFKIRLLSGRMIGLVFVAVICLLEAYHAVEAVLDKSGIALGGQRHHLDREVAEVFAADLEGVRQIFDTGHDGVFTGNNQQVLERPEFLVGLTPVFDFVGFEHHALEFVVTVEAAIYAGVGARVGDIHGYVHRNRLAETFESEGLALGSHLFEERSCRRRYEGHEALDAGIGRTECTTHVGGGHCVDLRRGRVPVILF